MKRSVLVLAVLTLFAVMVPASATLNSDCPDTLSNPPTYTGFTNGNDSWGGTAGDDVVSSGGGIDAINLQDGLDYACGDDGNDQISGMNGADYIWGNAGDDVLLGGIDGSVDGLQGGEGSDDIRGRDGNDYLSGGGAAADQIYDGYGVDTIVGNAADTLWRCDDGQTDDTSQFFGTLKAPRKSYCTV